MLFPAWGIDLEVEWLWLKITTSGVPVVPFDSRHKKPFESMLIGRARGGGPAPSSLPQLCIVSVPSLQHSRKPRLDSVLAPLIPASARKLEMFGRELSTGWTTWGNECFKHMQSIYYCAR